MNYTKDLNFNELINQNGTVIVDFYANWCAPCRMLGPVLEEIEEENGYKIVKVDVDEFSDLAERFNVNSIPRVLAFENGKLKADIVGYLPKDALLSKIK